MSLCLHSGLPAFLCAAQLCSTEKSARVSGLSHAVHDTHTTHRHTHHFAPPTSVMNTLQLYQFVDNASSFFFAIDTCLMKKIQPHVVSIIFTHRLQNFHSSIFNRFDFLHFFHNCPNCLRERVSLCVPPSNILPAVVQDHSVCGNGWSSF